MGRVVLFVGQAASPTGFARVVESLAEQLPREWDVHVLGTNARPGARLARATLHPNPQPRDLRAMAELPRVLERVLPRVVCLIDEPRGAALYGADLFRRHGAKAVLYAAIDRLACVTPESARAASEFDALVAYTDYGRRVLEAGLRRFCRARPRPTVSVVPHGVDAALFRPLGGDPAAGELTPARHAARARLWPDRPDLRDAFVVLNANRNQPGKRVDLTLEAFAHFARDKPPNVKLYLHMGTRPLAAGQTAEVDRLGLRERVLGVVAGDHPSLPADELNVVYNACDVGLNTSEGEGFGLIAFEHAATGAAQVVPRHSACRELWPTAALLLEPVRRTQLEGCRTAGRTVAPRTVADALERLYADRDLLRVMSAAAYRHALQPRFQWRAIAAWWARHFEELLA